ncbi:hypothetical protein AGMMS49990_02330 [Endomicrobiia bacterium]|nr:hypothetical protein AGMMS49990_02330 [Endomicrobiia bacterium]
MRVMVSVPVYNRKEYLEITARSLYECSNIDKVIIKVFNDCSSEFNDNYLRQLFNKPNTEIINRVKNLKADRNAYQMMLDFLDSDNDVLFICDSDLLLRPDTIDYIFNNFQRSDGFLGLYNSELHREIYILMGSLYTKRMLDLREYVYQKIFFKSLSQNRKKDQDLWILNCQSF